MNTVIEFNYSNSTDDWSIHGNSGGKAASTRSHNHLKLFELAETLNFRERALDPEHPNTLQSRHSMASGFYDMGRVQEGRSALRRHPEVPGARAEPGTS